MISLNLQKPTLMLIIAILLGWERFFLDDIGLGVVKVITCNGCGIWRGPLSLSCSSGGSCGMYLGGKAYCTG